MADATRDAMERRLRAELPGAAGRIVELAEPTIRLGGHPVTAAELPLGASALWPVAALPEGLAWPECDGRPLACVAQIRLDEVAEGAGATAAALPASGIVSFFYDLVEMPWGFSPADGEGWRVIYHDDDGAVLRPVESPDGALGDFLRPGCRRLSFTSAWSLPPPDADAIDALELGDAEHDAYDAIADALMASPDHRLLGHPTQIQGDMQVECQLVAHGLDLGDGSAFAHPRFAELSAGKEQWRLLLQLDSEEASDAVTWGDGGMLYYWIREADLAARRFDEVRCILQCF